MNPFHFGSSTQPLFGIHHPPAGVDTGCAVVLCYPVGSEYLRAHRAYRQLTNLLVRAGAHVLRFDYLGTGDSWGDPGDASVPRWLEDVGAAITELRDTTGFERLSVAGLRVGATLAAHAVFDRGEVNRVVLWDPILDGGAWLDALQADAPYAHDATREGAFPLPWPEGTVGLGGFPLTPRLAEGIRTLRMDRVVPAPTVAVDLLTSREDPAARELLEEWRRTRGPADAAVGYRCIPTAGDWAVPDRFGSALIPQAIIQGVVRCLTQG